MIGCTFGKATTTTTTIIIQVGLEFFCGFQSHQCAKNAREPSVRDIEKRTDYSGIQNSFLFKSSS
jgi:hypothetical protein